jgi:hypothetical protein
MDAPFPALFAASEPQSSSGKIGVAVHDVKTASGGVANGVGYHANRWRLSAVSRFAETDREDERLRGALGKDELAFKGGIGLGEGSQRVAEVRHGCVGLKQDSSAAVPLIAWTRRLLAAAGETEGDGRGIFFLVVVAVVRLLVASSRAPVECACRQLHP